MLQCKSVFPYPSAPTTYSVRNDFERRGDDCDAMNGGSVAPFYDRNSAPSVVVVVVPFQSRWPTLSSAAFYEGH